MRCRSRNSSDSLSRSTSSFDSESRPSLCRRKNHSMLASTSPRADMMASRPETMS
jgi:hypothetical protein